MEILERIPRMPFGFSVMFVLLTLMTFDAPVTSLKQKNMICDLLQECVCGFPTGEGVNLTSLGTEPIMLNNSANNLVFYFNPCVAVLASCLNSSLLCVVDTKTNNSIPINLGSRGGGTFSSQGLDGPIYLDYKMDNVGTEIRLECSNKNESTLNLVNGSPELDPDPDVKYHLLLQSPAACLKPVDYVNVSDGNISSGALFLLVLLIVFCSYLLIGAAANHFLRGASGWEMIPHYIIWRNLLTFFHDFIKFIANGCKSPASYEQI